MREFLSTLSLRRATPKRPKHQTQTQYFYPRSPCGERLKKSPPMCTIRHFYPRSPCGERLFEKSKETGKVVFLSTLSLRRATPYVYILVNTFLDFYPRSPCGERPLCHAISFSAGRISIHALLAESDLGNAEVGLRTLKFLSTLSLRRATQ